MFGLLNDHYGIALRVEDVRDLLFSLVCLLGLHEPFELSFL